MHLSATCTMHNGVEIPRLGLGVFRAGEGASTRNAVLHALSIGVRHIDTARIYHNEEEVGQAIKASGVPREEIFLTTKLWNEDQGYEAALLAFEDSRKRLGVEYLDLYLLHWPVSELRLASWQALETLQEQGRCRAIGVSNFTVRHLKELLSHAKIPPAVNQFELHPFLQQGELVRYCQEQNILVESYSPLTKGRKLDDPTLVALGRALGRSPAQVLIRWALQKDFVVIPKSSNPVRITENASVFDFALSPAQMEQLDALESGYRVAWDPTDVP